MKSRIENRAGRLIEVTLEADMTPDEWRQFRTRMWSMLGGTDDRVVGFADLRRATFFVSEVAEGVMTLFLNDNPKVERTALVVSGSATFTLQLERIVGEALDIARSRGQAPPNRRVFRDKVAAKEWVSEVLTTPAERERLQVFVEDMG